MKKIRIIDADSGTNYLDYFKECWQRRDLTLTLMLRDIKVKYTQTYLGLIWAVINPVISILLLMFVFNVVARVPTQNVPAILFTTSGLCAWNYFSKVVSEAGDSIIGAQSLVKKIYFPRLVIPLSKSIGGIIELGIVIIMLFILLIIYQYPINLKYFLLIPCIIILVLISFGCGVWVTALSIRYRDFHYIVPILLRVGMFVSPIAYGSQFVPAEYRWIIGLNPLTGIIDSFRWVLFGIPIDLNVFIISLTFSIVLLWSGLIYFIRTEKYIADII